MKHIIIGGLLGLIGAFGLFVLTIRIMADKPSELNQTKTEDHFDSSIDGYWTDGSGPNATFTIQGDTIRDVEHNTRTKFYVHGDSVTFLDPDPKEVYTAKMYLIHDDTLMYEFSGVKTKYWRFKD